MKETNQPDTRHFSHTLLPKINKNVFRMGIAGNYGIDSSDIIWAAENGANYWIWGMSYKKVSDGIKEVISTDREKHVIAMLGWGLFGWQVRKSVENALRQLNTDYLDVFKLGWLGRTSFYRKGIIDTLLQLKQEGKIKIIGTSIHDRPRAGRLTIESEIDLFMIRYNAKHPGAERRQRPRAPFVRVDGSRSRLHRSEGSPFALSRRYRRGAYWRAWGGPGIQQAPLQKPATRPLDGALSAP